jgi:hypothetical protein
MRSQGLCVQLGKRVAQHLLPHLLPSDPRLQHRGRDLALAESGNLDLVGQALEGPGLDLFYFLRRHFDIQLNLRWALFFDGGLHKPQRSAG